MTSDDNDGKGDVGRLRATGPIPAVAHQMPLAMREFLAGLAEAGIVGGAGSKVDAEEEERRRHVYRRFVERNRQGQYMDDFDRRVGDLLHLADYVANAFPQDKRQTAMTAALMAIHFVVHEDLARQELVEVRESVTRSRQGSKGGRKGRATKPGPRLVALVLKMRPALSEQPFRRFVEAIRERSGWEDLEVDASGIEYRTVETGAGRRKAWKGSVLIDGEPIDAGTLERAHRRQRQRLRDDASKTGGHK